MEAGDRDQVTLHLGEDEDADTRRPGLEDWLLATSWPRTLATLAISATHHPRHPRVPGLQDGGHREQRTHFLNTATMATS